ncbi:peptidoglycan D,D-transpeptidase FtsI family protein [Mediterraneibacter gnavus]|uniref:Penicillin-binding transpeptidase domain-containing protein n=1 Tax=Mediterraneibacter gnavus TaxID=33038 RepID=A0A9X3HGF3_MEDGN|nr:penicillin-binding transpeptidase domain-containing protein [Mediterraneibacter gnavus]MCZ7693678.1 penicillin-binding transpeptidase domain-containing protein [Mediterraneibacter gnavus]MCZ7735286.1 penicillin-binding transpeptidase domain-containing protein [Mediterraneibacter gnavus]MDC6146837.1 penicillin-binding transpeptidase domain-containing protein [Mediterraneibacter gnavus]MDE1200254.1 penicillin-binding transpeptidase domain-containing protein [Mediterraneibacter gnavus]
MKNKTYHKKKILVVFTCAFLILTGLIGRLVYLMVFDAEYYQKRAEDLHKRERKIKAARGEIVERNGVVLATNKTVCTISVIHSQIKEPERVTEILAKELEMDQAEVRKRVEKISSMEKVKTNVEKEVGDKIREYNLDGVKVDEDYKRYYPYDSLASKVLGFTGGDNQGIIGLEVKYEETLKGSNGTILTTTDARGIELDAVAEGRIEPVAGKTLEISMDYNIQKYCEQAAEKVMREKQADGVSILLMNPQNGEILSMVNVPEFNLNDPFELNTGEELEGEKLQDALNAMWRNRCINDTYEPGSTFKIITSAACLEEGVVTPEDTFSCPGYRMVEDRRIRCHKVGGHGSETFVQGIQNSCNPVFIDIGLRLGAERFYDYFQQFGLLDLTGIDLPGEAGTIMHQVENIGLVELATISFGQSFQVTPVQMAVTVSSIINGGRRVTPHFGKAVLDREGNVLETLSYEERSGVVSEKTSKTMQTLLEGVVANGSGKNAYIEGYSIGGKTATSQTLPRSANKYISSFIGFAPAEDPQVLGMVVIHNPQGIYYGGTIAAPVLRSIFDNVLPYLGIEKQ